MRTTCRLRFDAARRVLAFHRDHPPPTPAEAAHLSRLQALLDRVGAAESDQPVQQRLVAEAQLEREAILRAFVPELAKLVRLTVAVADVEGMPALRLRASVYAVREAGFLARVNDALALAVRHLALLEAHGLPPGRLTELEQALRRYEDAEDRRRAAQAASLRATATFESAVDEVTRVMRLLDAVARIRLAEDATLMAEWRQAASVHWEQKEGAGVGAVR